MNVADVTAKLPKANLEFAIAGGSSTEASTITDKTGGKYEYAVKNIDADIVGEVKAVITAEFEGTQAVTDESYKFEVVASNMVVEYNSADNDKKLAAADKTGTARSPFRKIGDEEIEVARNGLVDETYVSGSDDVPVFCFTVKANNSGGKVKVDDITVHIKAGSEVTRADLTSQISLYEKGKIDSPLKSVNEFDASNNVKFEDLDEDIVLDPNQQKDYCVKIGHVDDNAYTRGGGGAGPALLVLEIPTSGIVARDEKDRTATVTNLALSGGDIHFTAGGELTLTVNNATTPSKIITAGNTDGLAKTVVLAVDAEAVNDDIRIDKISFENDLNDTATAAEPTADEKKIINALQEVELYDLDTNKVLATAAAHFVETTTFVNPLRAAAGGALDKKNRVTVTFDKINSNLIAKKGETKHFGVRIETSKVNSLAKSGVQIRLQPVNFAADSTAALNDKDAVSTDIVAISVANEATIVNKPNDDANSKVHLNLGAITIGGGAYGVKEVSANENDSGAQDANDRNLGNLFVIRRSAPKFTVTTKDEALNMGSLARVMAFEVEPLTDKLQIARFTAEVGGTNVTWHATAYEVYSADKTGDTCPEGLESETYKRAVTVTANGAERRFTLTTPEKFTKGRTKCYAIKTNLAMVGGTGDELHNASIRIIEDAANVAQNTVALLTGVGGGATQENLVWTDDPASSQAATTDAAWVNGFKVEGLPTTSVSIK